MLKQTKKRTSAKKGITGLGKDYTIYICTPKEKLISGTIGFCIGAAAVYVMVFSIWISLIIGFAGAAAGLYIGRNMLQEKQKKQILLEFKEMLDSLNNTFSSGYNYRNAFEHACADLVERFGDKSIIATELTIISYGLRNNYPIEVLLQDFANRCGIDDINTFSETFNACVRQGGDLKKVVYDTRNILIDKIEIESELNTALTASKTNLNLLTCLGVGIAGFCNLTLNNSTGLINLIVKLSAFVLFVIAYLIGKKITHISF